MSTLQMNAARPGGAAIADRQERGAWQPIDSHLVTAVSRRGNDTGWPCATPFDDRRARMTNRTDPATVAPKSRVKDALDPRRPFMLCSTPQFFACYSRMASENLTTLPLELRFPIQGCCVLG